VTLRILSAEILFKWNLYLIVHSTPSCLHLQALQEHVSDAHLTWFSLDVSF